MGSDPETSRVSAFTRFITRYRSGAFLLEAYEVLLELKTNKTKQNLLIESADVRVQE